MPIEPLVRSTTSRGVPFPAEAVDELGVKPRLRGVFHQYAFFVSLGSGTLLVLLAATTRASVAVAIYAASVSALFGVSALYHRVTWTTPARRRMCRLDHAMIFLLIAAQPAEVEVPRGVRSYGDRDRDLPALAATLAARRPCRAHQAAQRSRGHPLHRAQRAAVYSG